MQQRLVAWFSFLNDNKNNLWGWASFGAENEFRHILNICYDDRFLYAVDWYLRMCRYINISTSMLATQDEPSFHFHFTSKTKRNFHLILLQIHEAVGFALQM